MAGPISLTSVDFDEIKDGLIDYLRSTKQFTDYDFAGSNLSVILNLLAYTAQLNAYSTNLIANESFLHTSTIRKNVVANARSLGYVPTSARAAISEIDLEFALNPDDYPAGFPQSLVLSPGLAFSTNTGKGNFVFNLNEPAVAAVANSGKCHFYGLNIHEGTYLESKFIVDKSNYSQRFILENKNVDATTIKVEIQEDPGTGDTFFYRRADNLAELTTESRIYWLEEVDNAYYELTFGDGLFGKEVPDRAIINVTYIVTNGPEGNGIQYTKNFRFVGSVQDATGTKLTERPVVTEVSKSEGGALVEDVSSIKYRAPREYAAQNRCVISEDYEVLTRRIFPAVEDIYVYGGETLRIPEYGRVYVVIKPTTGDTLSNITKEYIKRSLNPYRVASLDIVIRDPDILNVEVDTLVYFDEKKTIKDNASVQATVTEALNRYVLSTAVPKFGGFVSFSSVVSIIDGADKSITRNNTSLRMRKDMKIVPNTNATYEVCFDQELKNDCEVSSVYSTGFKLEVNNQVDERVFYFENDPHTSRKKAENSVEIISDIYCFYIDEFNNKQKVNFYETSTNILKIQNVPFEDKNITPFGVVNHTTGEIEIGYEYKKGIKFVSTEIGKNTVEIRTIPENMDIIARESVFIRLDVAKSDIRSNIETKVVGI